MLLGMLQEHRGTPMAKGSGSRLVEALVGIITEHGGRYETGAVGVQVTDGMRCSSEKRSSC